MLSQANYYRIVLSAVATISLALTATTVLGQTTSLSCITTGVDPGGCSQFIDTFCQSGGDIPPLAEQDNFSRCFDVPGKGYKCDFTAWNEFGTTSVNPSVEGCEIILEAVSEACPMLLHMRLLEAALIHGNVRHLFPMPGSPAENIEIGELAGKPAYKIKCKEPSLLYEC
ncbi:hypothetical protein BDP27DRAFT_1359399 [Rhodocollybia butyracea]|uniref:Glycan binding protein Y3-like domain-containing protein n=1 Tax=Rhodocollybia butyracea TaxID=206335 RepID=A0A9P5Q3D8_9AGAR|nr:hypothetical protein BDP27DRAFT_1359399 [Rhodocollybia butyracea]